MMNPLTRFLTAFIGIGMMCVNYTHTIIMTS